MDEAGDCSSKLYRGTRMPDEDKHEVRHSNDIMQQWKRHVEALQKSDLLQMQYHIQGRDGNTDPQREVRPSCSLAI
eukprot:16089612-Heterocapsa_arctica.AAC.1